ncbi:MAG TPA: FtsX-like permease family protein [Devosiaceae bacterium]
MRRIWGWMRVGFADLRGDLKRFGLLIACLALGTSVIGAVGSVGTGLRLAVERDATTLMGGDVEASRSDRDATPQELDFLKSLGQVAHVVDTTTRGTSGDNGALIDLVAVDDNYPLLGAVMSPQLSPGARPATLLGEKDGVFGAIVDPLLLDRLGIALGGRFRIGKTEFEARGTLTSLPDGALRGFHLGLTSVISTTAFAGMTDLRSPLPGLLTLHRYKIKLSGMTFDEAKAAIADHFKDDGWKTQSPRDAAGALVRYYDLFVRYLLIVGLSSLLVGGVGVSNGVSAYIAERQRSIAILRSLGATGARIMVHFLTQIGVLTLIGVALGLAAGAAASLVMLPLVGRALNVNLPATIEPVPLLIAAAFGILAGFAYAYLPLTRAQGVSPALLFRSPGAAMPNPHWRTMLRWSVVLPVLLASAGIFGLAVLTTSDFMLVAYYAIGVVVTYLLLRGSGWLLQFALRRLPPAPRAGIRNALRNVHSPGSSAPVVIVSIGLGLAMLLVIALLDSNLHNQLVGAVARDAPTFVATDLFDDEVQTLEQLQKDNPDFTGFEADPMLRGAVVGVNGKDPSTFKDLSEEATFLLSSEIPVTWRRDPPRDGEIVSGSWWPSDYSGPPLISLRAPLAEELGLKVGDSLQIRMFGDVFDAKIANLRDYQWQRGLNFMITFSPGKLQGYPSTYLGAIKAASGHEKEIERLLTSTFPDIAFIPIGEALGQVASLLGQLGTAVNIVGGLAVVNGLLVLAGTMASGRKQREADAVIRKVLGETRNGVLSIFVMEYCLLGAFAAVIASIVGIAAAWGISVSALDVAFAADPVLIAGVILVAVVLTVGAGAATTWRALSAKPVQFLRNN